ncbi:MAG: M23 family metallopeptidase [Fidelibacterota bacterium]
MKPRRYSIIVIPDNEGPNKNFSLSRKLLFTLIIFLILLIGGLTGTVIYMTPRTLNYDQLNSKYDELVRERTQVQELYRNLERLKQLGTIVQRTLGTDQPAVASAGEPIPSGVDSSAGFHISFIENIPSRMPVKGYVTQTLQLHTGSWLTNHYGIDIAVAEGGPVLAAASGQVVFSGWTPDLGNLVVIYHGDDYFTYYGHNQLNFVDRYQFVKRGEVIANVGDTGLSTGPHLHFEVWKDGQPLDPMIFFPEYSKTNVSTKNNG